MVLEEAGGFYQEMAVVIWTPFGGFHVHRNMVLTSVCVVFCPLLLAKRTGFFQEQLLAIGKPPQAICSELAWNCFAKLPGAGYRSSQAH